MIKNPILPGFHADPCVCRRGEDYYLAVSSFEWFPGVPIYHSKDLKHWRLAGHGLTDEGKADLRKLPSAKGVWAPCLTWCEEDRLFYLVYGVMNSMNARYFDVDNYVITAPEVEGPWSEPVYLHSAGFDASLFHDDDGRKWLVSLEWETRTQYEKPGPICLVEYDAKNKRVLGYPQRIWRGGTDRGCMEGPHLYKRDGYYYLMCAEGGTGYAHSVTMARSRRVDGPYEGDPCNPILTSCPGEFSERGDTDHLKPRYYNPNSVLQKSGHASMVETARGETYLFHLCSRPFVPELRCTLGRETAMQQMMWTEDGWLRLACGGNLAQEYVQPSALPDAEEPYPFPDFDDFDQTPLAPHYYAPRIDPNGFTSLSARPGYLRVTGQESLCSLNRASLVARKLTSVQAKVTTKLEFHPTVFQHSAGLAAYYDNMNYLFLRKYYSEYLHKQALIVTQLENGQVTEFLEDRIPLREGPVYLRLCVKGRALRFSWSYDGKSFEEIGPCFDTSRLSDEYCKYGEFTGAFVGMAVTDRLFHKQYADFDFFDYCADETADVR